MYNKFKDVIQQAYSEVELFNNIAGNLDNVTPDSLSNQLSFVFEELTETIDALESGDDKEFIDGLADIFVTVAGLLQKSEKAGYDVAEAIKRVNLNNLSKFPPAEYVQVTLPNLNGAVDTKIYGNVQPPDTTKEFNSQYSVMVFKDANGKVKKPLDFVPVDLAGTYPEGFLKGAS